MIKDAGIKLFTYNIVGFPFETKQHMQDTLRLNRKIQPDNGACTFFYPFWGTELYNICAKEGLLKGREGFKGMPANYNTEPVIALTPKQKQETIRMQKKISDYLNWRNFRYEQKGFISVHPDKVTVGYYLLGSFTIYLLLMRYRNKWLYRWYRRIVDSRFIKRISALLQ